MQNVLNYQEVGYFQQGNSHKHTVVNMKEQFQEKIKILKQPNQLPGLNLTENLWKEFYFQVYQRNPQI